MISRNFLHKFLVTNVTLFNATFTTNKRLLCCKEALNHQYYGIRFDRRSQNSGFHMIARSQLIAEDRRGSQRIAEDRTWFYPLRSSAIVCDHDRRIADDRRRSQKCVSIWSQTIAELFAICDPRSAIRDRLRSYGNRPFIMKQTNERWLCSVPL